MELESAITRLPSDRCEGVVSINLFTPRYANIVKDCLDVDEELQPTKIERIITVSDSILTM